MPSSVESPAAWKIPPVIVDAVLQTGVALGVGAGLPLQHDRPAVRHDEAVPDQQHAALTEGDLVVVLADQPRALRDQQMRPVGLS